MRSRERDSRMVRYERKDSKTILNKYRFIDGWFWCRYSINPYNGCEFSCTYCDSRSHKYHLHPEFDQVIYAKNDVGPMLDGRLTRARTLLPDVVAIGGTCDAYQPAEARFRNTRSCLEILHKHGYPVILSTKSPLVTRDLDLLASIARETWCTVGVTITTFREEVTRVMEPRAPSPEERLGVIETIKRNCPQIQAGVNLIPTIPLVTDDGENLREVVSRAADVQADFVLFGGGMTMRDNQANWFLGRLLEERPAIVPDFLDLYDGAYDDTDGYRGRYAPRTSYSRRINRAILGLCEEFRVPYRLRRFIPDDFRSTNYRVAEELIDESYLAQILGKPWTNLYWAGQNVNNLKEPLESVAQRNGLGGIRNMTPELQSRVRNAIEGYRGGLSEPAAKPSSSES